MAKISLGYKIVCDLCKNNEAKYKASFKKLNRIDRKQSSIRIGDACEQCFETIVQAVRDIIDNGGNDDSKKEEPRRDLGEDQGSQNIVEDTFELEEETRQDG